MFWFSHSAKKKKDQSNLYSVTKTNSKALLLEEGCVCIQNLVPYFRLATNSQSACLNLQNTGFTGVNAMSR